MSKIKLVTSNEIVKGVYQHYKGDLYEVIDIVSHSETEELLVLYKTLNKSNLWVRPLKMFKENVLINGELMPRFKKLETPFEEPKRKAL